MSSSVFFPKSSSSNRSLILCKASGYWGDTGCIGGFESSDGDLWSTGDSIVKTKVFAEDTTKFGERAGEIFVETDSIEGSLTQVFLSPDSSSKFNGLFSGTYQFDSEKMTENSYFNLGFNVAGFDSDGTALLADISNWKGICVMYRGSIDPVIQLDLGDSLNQKLGYALPSVMVITTKEKPGFSTIKAKTNEIFCYEWSQFKQPDIKGKHEIISGEEAAKHVKRVVFHFQAQPGSDHGFFNFLVIGTSRDQDNQSTPPEIDPCKGKGGKDCVVPGHGDLWSANDYLVNTKAYTYQPSKFGDNAGFFFFDDGSQYGLKSYIQWLESGWLSNPDYTAEGVDFSFGYRSGFIDLENGDMNRNGYFDIGFYVAGTNTNKEILSADISNWNGICVVIKYISSDEKMKFSMQLDLGDSVNEKIDNILPEVTLESSELAQCFEWGQFKQPNIDKEHEIISGEEAAKHVAKIVFHFESTLKTEVMFGYDLLAIGSNRTE